MQKHFILAILVAVPYIFGCHKKQLVKTSTVQQTNTTTTSLEPATSLNEDTIKIKNAIIDPEIDNTNTGSPYKVDSIKIAGDTLSVFVNYSGGCKAHSFELYSNGMYAKSLPPQLSITLKHIGNDDGCRKLIMEELKFDVANLKYAGKNTVILKLSDQRVTYTVE
ncbi:MAG: hypothetical protein V4608_08200 [Bacteroidota bacterium]